MTNRYGVNADETPSVLYHGTSREAWESIKRDGIRTDKDSGIPQPTDEESESIDFPYLWDGVWLTDSVERASEHGSVVIAVNASALRERIYEAAEDDVDGFTDYCIVDTIAPELILGASIS